MSLNGKQTERRRINWPFLSVAIFAILITLILIVYYFQYSNNISQRNAMVASLQSELTSAKTQIMNIQSELASEQNKIKDAQRALSEAINDNVSANKLSMGKSLLINSLQEKLIIADSQLSQMQDVADIIGLKKSKIIILDKTVNKPQSDSSVKVCTFYADYAGYLKITGTTTSSDQTVYVSQNAAAGWVDSSEHYFSKQDNLIPVLPGQVSVYLREASYRPNSTFTATVTVKYVY